MKTTHNEYKSHPTIRGGNNKNYRSDGHEHLISGSYARQVRKMYIVIHQLSVNVFDIR